MSVTCKHGTEVYKFRCPECDDEERGRNMTADKLTPDMATPQGTVAPRHAPNCKHAYMNDGFDCPFCLRDRLAASEKENADLRAKVDELEGDPILTDDECARALDMIDRAGWSRCIAAHRAQHTAPIRAKLDEAVGLIRRFVSAMKEYEMGVDEDPPYQHRIMMDEANAFLAERPQSEARGATLAPIRARLDEAVRLLFDVAQCGACGCCPWCEQSLANSKGEHRGGCKFRAFLMEHPRQGATIPTEKGAEDA